jgi:hypothetical protein
LFLFRINRFKKEITMKKTLTFAAMLLLLAGSFSCGKEEDDEPTEIPFTEYSLTGTGCQWTNLDCDGKIVIINSNTELENHVTCTGETFPEIDLAEQTLLIACGVTTNGIQYLHKKFSKKENMYILEIEITLNDVAVAQSWMVTLITNKLSTKDIELNVITIQN